MAQLTRKERVSRVLTPVKAPIVEIFQTPDLRGLFLAYFIFSLIFFHFLCIVGLLPYLR